MEPAPDVVVILWRMEELLSEALNLLIKDPAGAREAAQLEIGQLLGAVKVFLQNSNATVIVNTPPRPDVRPLGLLDARVEGGIAALHADVVAYWRRALGDMSRVHLVDVDGAQRDFGAQRAASPRMWLLAKIPWTEPFSQEVGKRIAQVVKSLKQPAKKVLVMDCDNTLWGGVVGEDGPLGVQVGEDAPGNAYVELQRYALKLRERGVLLALVSKNDEADVWEVFERNPGMILKREHISAARINWLAKSQNLRQIAQDLNLGSDSFVLIDDSAAECAEVAANAPEVVTLHLNGDAAYYVQLLDSSGAFDQLTLTSEDLQRADMYAQERQREILRIEVKTMEEYLAGLGLRVRVAPVSEEQLGRVTQLVNKTNQFNMTTKRYSEADVRKLWQDRTWHLYALSATDRFGEYGLTGVVFCVERAEAWEFDTLVLSCRVLGRGVETALLAVLQAQARQHGQYILRGRFIPTAKNGMAKNYYPDHGFIEVNGVYTLSANKPLRVPSHIALETESSGRVSIAKAPNKAVAV
ncbi:MAG: HAD-IIIC family phosphatase [Deltaproteobacteria bacterium]|nr:HAD-IIIC family phosphatase [Deltaproteobacteria bacterium]